MEGSSRGIMSLDAVLVKEEPNVHIKEEVEYGNEGAEWEDSASFQGVSEAAARAGLYAGHEVKDELVLGPEVLQPPDMLLTHHDAAAQTSDTREQPVLRECVVRLERIDDFAPLLSRNTCPGSRQGEGRRGGAEHRESNLSHHAARLALRECAVRLERVVGHEGPLGADTCRGTAGRAATLTNLIENTSDMEKEINCDTNIRPDKENYICDTCKKRFTLKDRLIKHINIHIYQSMEQERRRRGATDNEDWKPFVRGLSRQLLLRDCSVRLRRCGEGGRRASDAYVCDACGRTFLEKHNLIEHIRVHLRVKPKEFPDESKLAIPDRNHSGKKSYSCDICGRRLGSYSGWRYHRQTHAGKRSYSCDICGRQSASESAWRYHRQTHAGKKFSCKMCNKLFLRMSELTSHRIIHTGEKPFSCEVCVKQFAHLTTLNVHKRTHTGLRPYSCGICKKKFRQTGHLQTHKKIHTGEKNYVCEICKKEFRLSGSLKTHKQIHAGEKPFSCEICKKSFSQLVHLHSHNQIHTGEKPYACEICSKMFGNSGNLKKHKRIHTGEKPHSCEVCKKSFKESYHLQKHMRVHTGEKPYTCGICKKKFSDSRYFKSHKRVHTGEKPFTCEICEKKFAQRRSLRIHKRTHTGLKPYSCEICKKQFAQWSNMKTHERTHTGLKPYSCEVCKKQFATSGTLNQHKVVHTGERPYACGLCSKRYTQRGHLMAHKLTHA